MGTWESHSLCEISKARRAGMSIAVSDYARPRAPTAQGRTVSNVDLSRGTGADRVPAGTSGRTGSALDSLNDGYRDK